MVLEVVMLVVWIVSLLIFLGVVYSSGSKCTANPLVYGAKVLTEKNSDDFSCVCSFDSKPDYPIYVNSKEWGFEGKVSPYNMDSINFTATIDNMDGNYGD